MSFIGFPGSVIAVALDRQDDHCAGCGKEINPFRRGEKHPEGWVAHAIIPFSKGGRKNADNCIILCTQAPDCHLIIGHDNISLEHECIVDRHKLHYFQVTPSY
jgi:hypothetical protein